VYFVSAQPLQWAPAAEVAVVAEVAVEAVARL